MNNYREKTEGIDKKKRTKKKWNSVVKEDLRWEFENGYMLRMSFARAAVFLMCTESVCGAVMQIILDILGKP